MKANGVLPLGQTTTPYQIYDAFFDVTKAASGWDIDTVKQSLNVLTQTIDETYPHLSDALKGVERFSDTIGKRDQQVDQLLANANQIAGILGNRSGQINALLVNAQTLLAAINARGQAITYLLERVIGVLPTGEGLHRRESRTSTTCWSSCARSAMSWTSGRHDLADSLTTLSKFTASLGEAIASGPYFKVLLVNLLPYQILQPFVDAAFKKRGIDPENFWRGAGLPAFRWPDPNGTRFANGAPPPAPTPLEGTPDFPGPAVHPARRARTRRRRTAFRQRRTRCRARISTDRPVSAGSDVSAPPDVATSAPNPNGPGYTPGITERRCAGARRPPELQGVPVPLPPAPPGARTEPLGPVGPVPAVRRAARRPAGAAATSRTRPAGRRTLPPPGRAVARATLEVTDRCRRSSTFETSSCPAFPGQRW